MTTYITVLWIWTIMAANDSGLGTKTYANWRPTVEFNSVAACHEAAKTLNIKPAEYRCITKSTGRTEEWPK